MAATLKLGDRKWATKEGSLLAYNDENNNLSHYLLTLQGHQVLQG
jgi:hypothetical protein